MKRYGYLFAAAIIGMSVSGCMTPQGQPDNTASGALVGATTGAIIGSTARHPGAGALIGAAVGAVAGGAIGHGIDQAQEAQRAQAAQARQQARHGPPLTVADIKSLAKARVGDDIIISQIRNSMTVYHLTSADIIDLKRSGVSEKVIDYMINTPDQYQAAPTADVAGGAPPAPVVQPYIVAPGPDYFWVDGAWLWLGGRWIWHNGYWHEPYHRGYRHWR